MPKILLHIGAHKTATTYLQTRLFRNANTLRQFQVGYVGLERFRDAQAKAGGVRRAEPFWAIHRRIALARRLGALIAEEADQGVRRLVLSDENLLGNLSDISSGTAFYPRAGQRIRAILHSLRRYEVEVVLSIRSYDTFHVSAWSHLVGRSGYSPFSSDPADKLSSDGRGWSHVVRDLSRSAPDIPLHIWQYEKLQDQELQILQLLVGDEAAETLEPIGSRHMQGLSVEAVDHLQARHLANEQISAEEVRQTSRQFRKSKGYAAWSPWTPSQWDALRNRYASDLAEISSMAGVCTH